MLKFYTQERAAILMAAWTRDEDLRFDIAFALKNVTIPGFRKALKEEDRMAIAATILQQPPVLGRVVKLRLRSPETIPDMSCVIRGAKCYFYISQCFWL